MARLQAYGFIDSFTNSLNPTIEGLQTKIKRWINAEVTNPLGPTDNMKCKSHAPFTARLGGRACSCARPAGVRVRKLPSPPARPAAVRMCVARQLGARARVCSRARRAHVCRCQRGWRRRERTREYDKEALCS
jgi:hypothetical protein